MQIYVVQPGDTVDAIAYRFGVDPATVTYVNQLEYPYPLTVGQALLILDNQEILTRPGLVTNGYAYPFITQNILDETLPFLSELSVFSYGFTTDGSLIPPALNEDFMIESARTAGTKAILTLTPFGPDGKFNNTLIHQMLINPSASNNLIQSVLNKINEKGYSGADVDFEYILAEDRELFANFVADMTRTLNSYGYQVSVALAPKTSSDQKGLLYEGKDYRLLGEAANKVLLMTYEWGYTYSEPMAVAPINKVRQVVEYALTQIPLEKITMGIPNYGYDWPLPYEKGVTRATTIGCVEAVRLAVEKQSEILFDTTAMTPYFYYEENGISHEVWFEDVRSIQAKFDLVQEKGLPGVGYWQIMKLFLAGLIYVDNAFVIDKTPTVESASWKSTNGR